MNAKYICAFHAVGHDGVCPVCFPTLDKENWNVNRGRTMMLAELHAMKLLDDNQDTLKGMSPFKVATLAILKGMTIGIDISDRPTSLTRTNIDEAILKVSEQMKADKP